MPCVVCRMLYVVVAVGQTWHGARVPQQHSDSAGEVLCVSLSETRQVRSEGVHLGWECHCHVSCEVPEQVCYHTHTQRESRHVTHLQSACPMHLGQQYRLHALPDPSRHGSSLTGLGGGPPQHRGNPISARLHRVSRYGPMHPHSTPSSSHPLAARA